MTPMSIIRVDLNLGEAVSTLKKFKDNRKLAMEQMVSDFRESFSESVNQLLKLELQVFLGAAEESDNKSNGYTEKDYTFKGLGTFRLRYPRDRKGRFESSIVPKRERMDPRIKEDLAVLNLAGISNRTLGMISKRILGLEISKDTAQRSLDTVSESATKWLTRDITEDYWCLYIDGTQFSVRRRGCTEKSPSLVVLGVNGENRRSVLAIEPGTKDSVDCWRTVFQELIKRGLNPSKVRIGVMDGPQALRKHLRNTSQMLSLAAAGFTRQKMLSINAQKMCGFSSRGNSLESRMLGPVMRPSQGGRSSKRNLGAIVLEQCNQSKKTSNHFWPTITSISASGGR